MSFPIITGIHFDSNHDAVISTQRSHLRIIFSTPIKIPHDEEKREFKHYVKIMSGKIPMVVPNISDSFSATKINTTIRYSMDNGVGYSVITFLNGIYTVYDIDSYIKNTLVANGHTENDAVTGEIVYPFVVQVNSASRNGYLTIDANHSDSADVIVDLTNNTTSKFYELYGFTAVEAIINAPGTNISTNNVNIYDSQYAIKCDAVSSYDRDSRVHNGQVLHAGNLNGTRGGYLFLEARDEIIASLRPNTVEIDSMNISFEDRNGALLNFEDDSVDSNITLTLAIF